MRKPKKQKFQPIDINDTKRLLLLFAQAVTKYLDGVTVDEYRILGENMKIENLAELYDWAITKEIPEEEKIIDIPLMYDLHKNDLLVGKPFVPSTQKEIKEFLSLELPW